MLLVALSLFHGSIVKMHGFVFNSSEACEL